MSDEKVVPFDRKRALGEMIEGLGKILTANQTNLRRAEQMMTEAETSVSAYRALDGYVKGQIADLVALKRRIEEQEKQG